MWLRLIALTFVSCKFIVGHTQKARRPWSKSETRAVWKGLHTFIKTDKVPGKADCEACIQGHEPVLNQRSWKDVKYKVKTIIVAAKRDKRS